MRRRVILPKGRRVLADSFYAMLAGWVAQLCVSITFIVMYDVFYNTGETTSEFAVWMIFISLIVMVIAWVCIYAPFYFFIYTREKFFRKKWVLIIKGMIIGFIIPFGFEATYEYLSVGLTAGHESIWFGYGLATLAAITGGTAAEVGYRLRRKALRKINPGYDTHSARKTGPIKVLSEI